MISLLSFSIAEIKCIIVTNLANSFEGNNNTFYFYSTFLTLKALQYSLKVDTLKEVSNKVQQ